MLKLYAAHCKTVLLWLDVRKYISCQGIAGILIWSVTQSPWVALYWYWIKLERNECWEKWWIDECVERGEISLERDTGFRGPCLASLPRPTVSLWSPFTLTFLKPLFLHQAIVCARNGKIWFTLDHIKTDLMKHPLILSSLTYVYYWGRGFHLPGAFWKDSIAFSPEFFSSLFFLLLLPNEPVTFIPISFHPPFPNFLSFLRWNFNIFFTR